MTKMSFKWLKIRICNMCMCLYRIKFWQQQQRRHQTLANIEKAVHKKSIRTDVSFTIAKEEKTRIYSVFKCNMPYIWSFHSIQFVYFLNLYGLCYNVCRFFCVSFDWKHINTQKFIFVLIVYLFVFLLLWHFTSHLLRTKID